MTKRLMTLLAAGALVLMPRVLFHGQVETLGQLLELGLQFGTDEQRAGEAGVGAGGDRARRGVRTDHPAAVGQALAVEMLLFATRRHDCGRYSG